MSTYWKIVVTWVAIVAVAPLSASGRRQTPLTLGTPQVSSPTTGTTVDMDDLSGRPMVDVWLNGQGPFPMVVSTSATTTALTADLITELGIAPDTELTSGPVVVEDVRVGEAEARGVTVTRTILAAAEGELAPRGILSVASFPGLLVTLDYPDGKLRLQPGALGRPDGHRVFDYRPDTSVPTVSVDIAGRAFDVEVDSNAPGGLTLPTRDAADLPLADAPVEIGRVADALGELPVLVATLNGLVTLGEFPLPIHSVVLSDVRPRSSVGLGSIGARVLETFVVTIDPKTHRVAFDRPAA
jgi:hypothetical protein